jgi:hypothetical protein
LTVLIGTAAVVDAPVESEHVVVDRFGELE